MITRNNITNTRIAELSATLEPIESPYTETAFDEIWGEANDFISYKSPYYYNGLQRVDCDMVESTCILQKVEEFQVLRFFGLNVYMSGECMYNYYSNEFEKQEDPNWMDDEFYTPDDLEIKDIYEYKQVWIDRQGNAEIIDLRECCADQYGQFIKIESIHDWSCEPRVKNAILDCINEKTDFCYTTNEEPTLTFYLSQSGEYLRMNEPDFYRLVASNGLCYEAEHYFSAYKVAHRHGFEFPKDYPSASRYFSYLSMLAFLDVNLLSQVEYVTDLSRYDAVLTRYNNKLEANRQAEAERRRLEEEKRIQEEQTNFEEQHSWLFDIEFDSEELHYKSLDSVEAYKVEGDIMHHCIFRCEYYKKPYYLAMHITDHEGNRVATCTVDLQRRAIDQIQPMCDDTGYFNTYGIDWKTTEEYKEIYNTLMARMHTFPKPQIKQNKQLKIA